MTDDVVKLLKGAGRYLQKGGPWIYNNEIADISPGAEDGGLVRVCGENGWPLGQGFLNRRSKLTVRMLTRDPDAEINEDFFLMRLKNAWEYRKKVVDTSSCRLVFGEADFLPGLVVDKFSDVLVVESLALGIDRFKVTIRLQEGMERYKGFLGAPFDTKVEIVENGVRYFVDVKDGQKTGFFLDQKYNRQAVGRLCRGARVLDCFTHTGSFALNAGICGAEHVIGVDASELGVAQARENAALNGLEDRVEFLCTDVFDLLPQLEQQGEQFDVVILDPPAFTKSRSSVKKAVKGYREINLRAMKLVRDGGFLATCSCSHFMDYELFTQTIGQAARNVHKRLRQVEYRTQSPDHPILWAADDSYYLKFYIFQVCDEK